MSTFRSLTAACLMLMASSAAIAQPLVVKDVKARFSKNAKDRVLVDKNADLVFDDAARLLSVKNDEHPLSVRYDDVQKVVFDVSTHMRGGAMAGLIGGIAGAAIASKTVEDYWCYIEYRGPDGTTHPYMIEIGSEAVPQVRDRMQVLFGGSVVDTDFTERESPVEKSTLKDLQSKHALKVDKANHPLPEPRSDKALVVVVCPPLAARNSGKGNQFKLHANDQVVAVNKMGTYSFAYLEPGDYRLVSQTENASGFTMTLEAGKEYYFLQDTFMGAFKARTALSRHSKELVMYELSGAQHADWKRK